MIDNGLLMQMLLGALLGLSVYLPLAAGQLSLATPAFYAVGGTLAALLSTRWSALGATADGGFPVPSLLLLLLLGGLLAGLLALAGWFCQRLDAMPLGRAMAAIRDDELAASCMGIDTTRVKLTAFVLSAVLAGSTGALAAHFLNTWNARQGTFDASITTLAFVILGGSRTWLGPVVGGLLLTALPELLRPVGDVRLVLFGLVILLGPVLAPQGLITPGLLERLGGGGKEAKP